MASCAGGRLSPISAQGSLEEEYENGSLAETRRYDRSGNILEERFFSPPEPSAGGQAPGKATEGGSLLLGYFVYSYADDRLSRMEAFDPGAHVVGSMTYRYDPQGRLLEVRAAGSLGDSRAGMTPGSGLPAAAWTSIPDDTEGRSELTRYDRAGRPVERSRYLGKTGLSVELLAYSATGLLVSSREYVQASGTITETTYDPAGRASLVVVLVQGLERSRRSFSYDDESRLVEDTLVTESCTTKVLHEYGREGELERATTSIDGVTVLVVTSLRTDPRSRSSMTAESPSSGPCMSMAGSARKNSLKAVPWCA